MKIIQTYWSKPSVFQSYKDQERYNGGWRSPIYHAMSIALSCLSIKRFYPDIELFTDTPGKEFLIDRLKLPYSRVHVCLDNLIDIPPLLWAAPKLYVYSLQQTPFIHMDNDVYIWKRLGHHFETCGLLAQHEEINYPFYLTGIEFIFKNAIYIPRALRIDWRRTEIRSLNAGILGGSDLEFIHDYSKIALKMITLNNGIHSSMLGHLNYIAEQCLFAGLASQKKKKINFYLPSPGDDYSDLLLFHQIPKYKQFIHVVGDAKRNATACHMVEMHLKYYFPEHHALIGSIEILSQEKVDTALKRIPFSHTRKIISFPELTASSSPLKKKEELKSIDLAVKKLKSEPYYSIAKDIYKIELQYDRMLVNNPTNCDTEFIYNSFRLAKEFLSSATRHQVLRCQYELAPPFWISTSSYPIPDMLQDTKWLSKVKLRSADFEKKQRILLHVKYSTDRITSFELTGIDLLLYVIDKENLCGNDLSYLLRDQNEPNPKPLSFYNKIVYNFLATHLLYTNYIRVKR